MLLSSPCCDAQEVHNRKRFEEQFGAPEVVEIPTMGPDGDDKKAKKKKPPPKKPIDHQRLFRDNIDGTRPQASRLHNTCPNVPPPEH